MTSVNQNFTIYAGDTASITVGITTDSGTTAASLAGASAVWIAEEEVGSGSVIRLTTNNFVSLSGSIATLAIAASDTVNLAGKYYHELEVTDTNGNISTTTTGIVTIKKSGASL